MLPAGNGAPIAVIIAMLPAGNGAPIAVIIADHHRDEMMHEYDESVTAGCGNFLTKAYIVKHLLCWVSVTHERLTEGNESA